VWVWKGKGGGTEGRMVVSFPLARMGSVDTHSHTISVTE
jgi:hypothetical protein